MMISFSSKQIVVISVQDQQFHEKRTLSHITIYQIDEIPFHLSLSISIQNLFYLFM